MVTIEVFGVGIGRLVVIDAVAEEMPQAGRIGMVVVIDSFVGHPWRPAPPLRSAHTSGSPATAATVIDFPVPIPILTVWHDVLEFDAFAAPISDVLAIDLARLGLRELLVGFEQGGFDLSCPGPRWQLPNDRS